MSWAFRLGILLLVSGWSLFWSVLLDLIVKCGSFFSGPLGGSVGFLCCFLGVLTVIMLALKGSSSSSLHGVDIFPLPEQLSGRTVSMFAEILELKVNR